MKPVRTTREFDLHYKARITKNETLKQAFQENLNTFLENPSLVDDHSLEKKMYIKRSFSISDDYRVVYLETPEYLLLMDIGTHDEVYYR